MLNQNYNTHTLFLTYSMYTLLFIGNPYRQGCSRHIGVFDINVSTCLFHTQGLFVDSIVTCKYYLGYSSDFNKQRYA